MKGEIASYIYLRWPCNTKWFL